MENIMVKSATNRTVVIHIPDMPLHKVWKKKGSKLPVDRKTLIQAYYDPSVEFLFKNGMLTTDDKEFLVEVGLMTEDGEPEIIVLSEALLKRYISVMPLQEFKTELMKLTHLQIEEVAQYAIDNYAIFNQDRLDVLSKASGIDIYKAIGHRRAAEEK